jgi:ribosomal protein S18 acetylase RimI-like enzyme
MIHLIPMSAAELQDYLADAIQGYAQEHVRAGNWTEEEALERSGKEFAALLPDGVASKDQHLFSVLNESSEPVGMIWFAVQGRPPSAFIYDFRIYDRFQHRGYGRQTLAAIESEIKQMGLGKIGLHVFGHNHAARSLYEKMGYEVTNVLMEKQLDIQDAFHATTPA